MQTTPAANRACGVISGEFPPSSIFSRFRTECIIRPLVISAVKITQRLRTCHRVQTTPAANRACGVISGEFPPSSIFSRFRTECIIRPLVISAVKITQRWRRSPDWISAHMSSARLTQLPLRTELIIIEISVLASSLFPAVERTHFTRKKVFRNYTRPPNPAQ